MNLKNKTIKIGAIVLSAFLLIMIWGIFVPYSFFAPKKIIYHLEKGTGFKEVGIELKRRGFIRSHGFFTLYSLLSLKYNNIQAGDYEISTDMSVADMVKKFAAGDVVRNNITIIEGWNLKDIGEYLEAKKIVTAAEFLAAAKNSGPDIDLLKDKPKKLNLEGYIFPDTYSLPKNVAADQIVNLAVVNLDKKLTPELRQEIARQKKSIFEIITMASMLEKEVRTLEDKKIVSGLLWKRIDNGIGLNVDATVNYATGKNTASISTKDIQIDSPYNTYKYRGLPLGPISNPGLDSILAAIYPVKSPYWYYLSEPEEGQTIFSKTLEEHNAAVEKYLR